MSKTNTYSTSYFSACVIIILAALFINFRPALADDVGITKARLIQKSEKSYVLEADITRVLVWAIKPPIFPDRFQVSELKYVNQSGWIVVQATATTSGDPLSAQDEILLPWMRNGVAITVQLLDGSIRQGVFLRALEGIHIPMRMLMTTAMPLVDVCIEHFKIGLKHLSFKWIHLLFVWILVLLLPINELFKSLLYFTFGQAFSLVLADFGLPGFDLLFVDIMGSILIFMFSYTAVRNQIFTPYLSLLFVFGLFHGLAYTHELRLLDIPLDQKLPVLFMFNVAMDAGHFVAAIVLLLVSGVFSKMSNSKKIAIYTTGTLSVAVIFVLFQEHVTAGKTDVLIFRSDQIATRFALPVSQNTKSGGGRPRGARRLTSPIMSYLSVEPYEVRKEILIQARAAVQLLGVNDEGMASIPIESLSPVKQGILRVFQKTNPIFIDGQPATPVITRAEFVTLGPAGVIVRPSPVPESLDSGIIGLTLVYETPDLADEVTIDWQLFSDAVQKIEATTTDPFGGTTMILSPDNKVLRWRSRLSGYRVPVIKKIAVEKHQLPVFSILLFLTATAFSVISILRKKSLIGRSMLFSVIGLGFVFYPFYRVPVDNPFISKWAPSTLRTSTILDGLLTNVYRSFDVRDENRVYDRLEMSVLGDQLAQIYLQNRKSLELENRGGARANVDEVEILKVNDVKRSDDEGFIADAAWTVSGSVSHFGHTHYRRNQYHAKVTFVGVDGSWKIKNIELIDEKRLL